MVVIKHSINFELEVNSNSKDETMTALMALTAKERKELASQMTATLLSPFIEKGLKKINKNNTWAKLRFTNG